MDCSRCECASPLRIPCTSTTVVELCTATAKVTCAFSRAARRRRESRQKTPQNCRSGGRDGVKTRLAPSNEFRSSTDAAVRRCCQRGIAPSRTKLGAPASSHMTNLPLATWLRRRRSTRSAEAGRWRRKQRRRRRQRDGLAVGETCRLVLAMLIAADHGRSEPSISGCNTSPRRSDAHRGRASGGVSRQHSLLCTRRRVSVPCARA